MLKQLFCIVCIVLGVAIAQDTPASMEANVEVPMQCIVGNGEGKIATCPNKKDVCQTKLEIKKGHNNERDKIGIFRECKQLEACDANIRSNFGQCYSRGALTGENIRICHFCCFGPMCNELGGLPLEFRRVFGLK